MSNTPAPTFEGPADPPTPFAWPDVAAIIFGTWVSFTLIVFAGAGFYAPSASDSLLTALAGAAMITVIVSGCSVFLIAAASPLAWLLGRALRKVPGTTRHVAAFSALGGVSGLLLGLVMSSGSEPSTAIIICGLASAVALGFGRLTAFWIRDRRARAVPMGAPRA